MLIGVDFDNTIVCYDRLFHRLAVERGLAPASVPPGKGPVRDYLRRAGKEDCWTELQGDVYGAHMGEAEPFPGVLSFFSRCRQRGVPVRIISHRSRFPYAGKQHDLHQAARDWLRAWGFQGPAGVGLDPAHVFLDVTKEEKLGRIAAVGCSHFIDDLPELLGEAGFPANVVKILFDPNQAHANCPHARSLSSWSAIERFLLTEGA